MTLRVRRHHARPRDLRGNALTFWCFSESEITPAGSPLIYLLDVADNRSPSIKLVDSDRRIPAGRWVLMRLPFAAFTLPIFNGTEDRKFNSRDLARIVFMQGLDDNVEQHAVAR